MGRAPQLASRVPARIARSYRGCLTVRRGPRRLLCRFWIFVQTDVQRIALVVYAGH